MDFDFEESYQRPSWLSSFIDEGTTSSHRYYLSWRTVLEMLRDRGYIVPNEDIELTLQEFRDRYGEETDVERLRLTALHKDDPSNKILVHFFGPIVVKVNNIKHFARMNLNEEAICRMIMIVDKNMTSQATKALELLSFQVEVFKMTELLINITKHELQPKHQLLTTEEKQMLIEKYNIEETQKDAVSRYYAYEKGMVVKVTYNSEATETHESYRIIV